MVLKARGRTTFFCNFCSALTLFLFFQQSGSAVQVESRQRSGYLFWSQYACGVLVEGPLFGGLAAVGAFCFFFFLVLPAAVKVPSVFFFLPGVLPEAPESPEGGEAKKVSAVSAMFHTQKS